MDLNKYKEFIEKFTKIKESLWLNKQFQNNKSPVIVFGGYGESLKHPKFFEFVQTAKKEDYKTTLITNGLLLTEKNCEGIIESGLDKLAISLHTLDRKINKKIMGIDSLSKIEKALYFFDKSPLEIEIWRTSRFDGKPYNYKETPEDYSNFLSNYGKSRLVLGPTPAWNRGGQFNSDFYPVVHDKGIRCQRAYFTLNVSFNGDFVPCCCDFSTKANLIAKEWDFNFEKVQKNLTYLINHPSEMCRSCRKPSDDDYKRFYNNNLKSKNGTKR